MKPIRSRSPYDSCTSFCLDNHGYGIFGANYDHSRNHEGLVFVNKRHVAKSYWEIDAISEHAQWTSRYGSVTFNLVMREFAWGGMNEAGLVVSTLELAGSQSPVPDARPWLYSNYWVQYLLDNFSTIDEVIASDAQVRIKDYVDHYLVCDRQGNCATIEFLGGRMVCHTGPDLSVKALANHSYQRSLADWLGYQTQQTFGEPDAIQDPLVRRFIGAAERVKAFTPTDSITAVEYALATLDAISGQNVNGSPTQWSIVFDTEQLKLHFRTSQQAEVRSINLNSLDFSCQTPVKMLDIHAQMQGDITPQLPDYAHEQHHAHALHTWRKWGGQITPEALAKQLTVLERFPCDQTTT